MTSHASSHPAPTVNTEQRVKDPETKKNCSPTTREENEARGRGPGAFFQKFIKSKAGPVFLASPSAACSHLAIISFDQVPNSTS